jgi:hypothetical protein
MQGRTVGVILPMNLFQNRRNGAIWWMLGKPSVVVTTLLGMLLVMTAVHAKEIPFDITYCTSGTVTPVVRSKAITLLGFELRGIGRSNLEDNPFDNLTTHCVGTTMVKEGSRTVKWYCKLMDLEGDFIFMEGSGTPGNAKRTIRALSGTGKWQGITGGGANQPLARGKPITPDTFQNCSRATGTYILPD